MQQSHARQSCRSTSRGHGASASRSGSVLITVFVVVLLLALGGYRFTMSMIAEMEATKAFERDAQTRAFADSGIEWVAAVLGTRVDATTPLNLYDDFDLFAGIALSEDDNPRLCGRFSAVVGHAGDAAGQSLRFGLIDESSKFNLNALLVFDLDEEQQRDILLALPDMTIEIADAILDWIDDDEQPRQFGAENEYYGTLSPPYEAKNAPLESIDELLRIREITPQLLYGEDANRNGLLDPEENDGAVSLPFDNADGVLLRGWSAHLTVRGRETTLRADGSPRINVNDDDLAGLYDALLAEFDEETARFVVAYRLSSGAGSGGSGDAQLLGLSAESGETGDDNPTGIAPSGNRATPSGNRALSTDVTGAGGNRGGLDLSGGAQREIASLFDLIATSVRAKVDGQDQELESPWGDDPSSLGDVLPELLDGLTTTDAEFIVGRVNVAEASREVLMMIPELDEQLVAAIVGGQIAGVGASDPMRSTTGWLLSEGIVSLEQMRALDPYVTGGGGVFRTQIVGYFEAGGPMTRLEAIVDATQRPPRVTSIRDLTGLGWGYSIEQLVGVNSGAF